MQHAGKSQAHVHNALMGFELKWCPEGLSKGWFGLGVSRELAMESQDVLSWKASSRMPESLHRHPRNHTETCVQRNLRRIGKVQHFPSGQGQLRHSRCCLCYWRFWKINPDFCSWGFFLGIVVLPWSFFENHLPTGYSHWPHLDKTLVWVFFIK